MLVTSALPYANGPIHLGHLVEYIQTDIWARFQRMRGHAAYYVCADDAHGTPIMLKAEDEGVTPAQLIERFGREHRRDFEGFLISFDPHVYSSCNYTFVPTEDGTGQGEGYQVLEGTFKPGKIGTWLNGLLPSPGPCYPPLWQPPQGQIKKKSELMMVNFLCSSFCFQALQLWTMRLSLDLWCHIVPDTT